MNSQFVSYEIALKLKKLEFNKKCIGYYMNSYLDSTLNIFSESSQIKEGFEELNQEELQKAIETCHGLAENDILVIAPLYQQVFDWFWDKHHIAVFPYRDDRGMWYNVVYNNTTKTISNPKYENRDNLYQSDTFENWNDCKHQAILEALKLI